MKKTIIFTRRRFGERHIIIYIHKVPVWMSVYSKHMGWFRLFGVGLKWKHSYKVGLTFSERNGYRKYLKIGKWIFGYLPKIK